MSAACVYNNSDISLRYSLQSYLLHGKNEGAGKSEYKYINLVAQKYIMCSDS